MQGYDSKELVKAFMAFFHALFSRGPKNEVAINDNSFLLKCCVSAGFTEAEAEEFVRASDDAATKQRLRVREYFRTWCFLRCLDV
jgi:hypothetical protein